MNKAITDGIVFQPLPFSAGLGVWSSGEGTPGSDTYAISGSGVFVAADADFAGCLEILKVDPIAHVRYMTETPILPGCYLRVTAKVKAISGPLAGVRVSGWAGVTGGAAAAGLPSYGPEVQLTTYGEVVEITAIIGTGDRTGVDMLWTGADYGHLGIDLTGPTGGVVRVDDIQIEDVSAVFTRDLLAIVDVLDYGAKGDGVTDDSAAFEAADTVADGRTVMVPPGNYLLQNDVTMENHVKFEGRIIQDPTYRFIMQRGYNYDAYLDAFQNEELAFKKAYQALINFADHESLDLCGRRVALTEPVDMQACDPTRLEYATRRVVRNGQFQPVSGAAWDTEIFTSTASYAAVNDLELTNVVDIANIPVGSLVSGNGVGREIYVSAVDVPGQSLTLSAPLYDAEGSQNFTFTRFKYLLDFSGYDKLNQFVLDDIEFQGSGIASGIMLAPAGLTFHLRDCFVNKPKDRGLTSPGRGCQGMMIDRCQFISDEQSLPVAARVSIGFNANANDVKIRDNRVNRFKHFCILSGSGSLITANHWFHGDDEVLGVRKGGVIITSPNPKTIFTGNYCDNNFIEWTNEHSSDPALGVQFSFGGLTITGNIFLTSDVASWANFIVIKPYGPGHYISGFAVLGNVFRSSNGQIDRVERVDTTFADLDYSRTRGLEFRGNTFHNVHEPVANPVTLEHDQATEALTWVMDTGAALPFEGHALYVDSVLPDGAITNSAGTRIHELPWAEGGQGADNRTVHLNWGTAVKGRARYHVRMDNPY
ncbi:right-handed parallel beta-helix repeat-containing protein [Loktanella sp. D2R18]|uniref:glycosyl hydrolase family 28-related protein n=1 Tax=Rhodobacterales TaxID=204455 RepID=UPI000DEA7ECF|nr:MULTISPECIES: glycosyl hydrolase family 28-related protein [Rhodobacterales]MDO6588749.1 glycosyl hydrolase family 28-related protein [Yoonia sp. 1_MG-2023]RBW42367.1 right-handed parallel beta-helix repeat-containing protein [Loktanella sp. D2R18]